MKYTYYYPQTVRKLDVKYVSLVFIAEVVNCPIKIFWIVMQSLLV